MDLPFLNRQEESARLKRFCRQTRGSLAVLYGRRRCGKSRLLTESLAETERVYYLADEREASLQRQALAQEISQHLPGFQSVIYPDWDALLSRWWSEARSQTVLVLDEFPAMVSQARELPSVIQRHLDRRPPRGCHLALCGSSQRMMQGLVLDQTAPLFGRALEILKIQPLKAGWIVPALQLEAIQAVEAYSVWGGVPRYWELAADYATTSEAVCELVLNPLGVLQEEPTTLLLDELQETAQSSSILQLIGFGCHRLSEIAARLGKPSTSLVRPLQRLVELDLVSRERPFGAHAKDSKKSLYRLADPFLKFWFRYIGPRRSQLQSRQPQRAWRQIEPDFPQHVGEIWEELARLSVPHADLHQIEWKQAFRWWGQGSDGRPLEIDLVAESVDGHSILFGSVKWEERTQVSRLVAELKDQSQRFPLLANRRVYLALWLKRPCREPIDIPILDPEKILTLLR
ncbi:MAG: ATP-binding protein [Candidatus Eremiobacteraeota bacterium]|nr:ATP-binding protein [Candidatus Eremiobacteraeota bacterium]MCW5865980.1 ATP-binding protein [Candidatus Eremiobacteraeota bacterium]